MIGKLLPAPAAVKLTDERIKEISRAYRNANDTLLMDISFARAIESEVLAHAGVGAASLRARPEVLTVPGAIINIPCKRTMSHFATQHEMLAYKEGHRDARHAAADLVLERADELALLATPSPQAQAAVSEQTAAEIRRAALEEAAKACDAIYQDHRDQYKGRGKYAPNNPRRADPHCDGCADGAVECADAIRELATKEADAAVAPSQEQLTKWWSMRGAVVTAAINGHAVYLPPGDADELLNVFDAALPVQQSAQGENGGDGD